MAKSFERQVTVRQCDGGTVGPSRREVACRPPSPRGYRGRRRLSVVGEGALVFEAEPLWSAQRPRCAFRSFEPAGQLRGGRFLRIRAANRKAPRGRGALHSASRENKPFHFLLRVSNGATVRQLSAVGCSLSVGKTVTVRRHGDLAVRRTNHQSRITSNLTAGTRSSSAPRAKIPNPTTTTPGL